MYTGTTKNLAVIGYPIAHSLSPVIQNTALTGAGLDYAYIAVSVVPEELPAAVAGDEFPGLERDDPPQISHYPPAGRN